MRGGVGKMYAYERWGYSEIPRKEYMRAKNLGCAGLTRKLKGVGFV